MQEKLILITALKSMLFSKELEKINWNEFQEACQYNYCRTSFGEKGLYILLNILRRFIQVPRLAICMF